MSNLLKFIGILTLLMAILILLPIHFLDAEGNPLMEFVLKLSEKEIKLGEIRKINSELQQMEFTLPSEKRSWPLYVKGDFSAQENSSLESDIKVSVVNDSDEEIQLEIREIETNNVKNVVLVKGDECPLFTGKLKTFIFELKKDNLLRNNGDETYSEWKPLVLMRSRAGGRIKGKFKFTSNKKINLSEPMIIYVYLPADTL